MYSLVIRPLQHHKCSNIHLYLKYTRVDLYRSTHVYVQGSIDSTVGLFTTHRLPTEKPRRFE
jgi:hypothetical protein